MARPQKLMSTIAIVIAASVVACGGDSLEIPTPTPTTVVAFPTQPQSLPASATPAASATAQPGEEQEYTVQAGDTLGAIATQFGVTVEAIVEANGIVDPNTIVLGQLLTIPAAP